MTDNQTTTRPCTCHPSEAPIPCQHKYALSECMAEMLRKEREHDEAVLRRFDSE
jgi:hypothetical protein